MPFLAILSQEISGIFNNDSLLTQISDSGIYQWPLGRVRHTYCLCFAMADYKASDSTSSIVPGINLKLL